MTEPIRIEIEAVAEVVAGHKEPVDDFQGDVESIIRMRGDFPVETLQGLDEFSHLEVLWHFHRASPDDVALHARSPRNNPDWPRTGTFVHRNHRRPNQLAVSHPRLVRIEGRDLYVTDFDAVVGTPVFDVTPYFPVMGPRGQVRVPTWVDEMLAEYWAAGEKP
ncbi:TrmO family methyltransferase domain-containing protein [Streptomyces hygroscopicus]|uniref:TrmO family methyltransferase domain-containing protein n=1 Tax=Streptomyces hygroscopicus TaxID=1912 RepID=UPI0004CAF7DA|nr:TrmO family methyltransferase [Streptomyces hygroscopicus]